MPYANEHACRLKDPGNYEKFRRVNCEQKHDGKCIDVIYGITEGKSEIQAYRYDKEVWDEEDARAHCTDHDGTFEAAKEEEKSMEKTRERRYVDPKEMRFLEGENGELIIEGYPIVYERYAELWWFKEIIRQGAAKKALAISDELVLWNHDPAQPMARRSTKTLEATEDDHGVFIRADVSKTVWGRNGYEAIKNGVIDKMSFCFDVELTGEIWTHEEFDGTVIEVREITELKIIYDYSPVSYPAYEDTEIIARSRALAVRNKPDPEASGDGDPAGELLQEQELDIELYKLER